MRSFWFVLSLCVVVLFGMAPLLSASHAAKANARNTQVSTDENTQTVSVVINGKQILVIDGKGLHVTGSIVYDGTIRDTNGMP